MEIVHRIIHQRAEEKGEELVVLTQVLAHDLTVGYEDLENMLLLTVTCRASNMIEWMKPMRKRKQVRFLRVLQESCSRQFFLFRFNHVA